MAMYIVVGILLNRKSNGGGGIRENFPHKGFWFEELPSLLAEGLAFSYYKLCEGVAAIRTRLSRSDSTTEYTEV
jgi:hypothetical protein